MKNTPLMYYKIAAIVIEIYDVMNINLRLIELGNYY